MTTMETLARVTLKVRDRIAIIEINNPPVNAASHAVRRGLVDALNEAEHQGVAGAILMGAGRCFVAGSDLREFGKKLAPPELPDVIRAIEDVPFPVVAAMHGVALGGGLELALGCDYRIASQGTKLGLPEVSLGFVPGAGGTQRLPRLTGICEAITLICQARRIAPDQAQKIGVIDAIIEGDLLTGAIAFLTATARPKRLTLSLPVPHDTPDAIQSSTDQALKRGKGRDNVLQAIRLIKRAADGDSKAALTDERAVFQRLRVSDDAFALRHLFFAERLAATIDGIDPKLGQSARRIGVVGGGTMGQGIARAFLAAGCTVTIVERDTVALDLALAKLRDALGAQVTRGRLSASACHDQLAALSGTVDTADLSQCDLVIEAVFEDMGIKKDLLGTLETVLAPDAIIATNTSYLDIDQMAGGLIHPERVLGLHFFSPADVMPLLEVVRTAKTSDTALASGLKLARMLGKQPVVSRVAEGFIGNRIYAAYRRRAELLVLDGASPDQVDSAARAFGFAMGVFAVSDMSGLDIAWAMRKRQADSRDPAARYVTIPDTLCETGRLGRKTGKGWYDYKDGKPVASNEVAMIIDAARRAAGIQPVTYDVATLQRQLMAAIVNEAACLLEEGVAQRASDVDVAFCNGYGFPRWRGGPLYWAQKQAPDDLRTDLLSLAAAVGHGFRAGPVDAILTQIREQAEA